MNFQQIEYVIKVAEELSFSKASKKLFITQPSLSQVISKLETQLGFQIFDRTTSPIQITQAGAIFIKHAKEMMKSNELIKSEVAELNDMKRGILNIGVNLSKYLLAPSISEFSSNYSSIKINVFEDNPSTLEKMLINGTIDLAVTVGKFDEKLFNREILVNDRMYLAVSERNPINRNFSSNRLFAEDIKSGSLKMFEIVDLSLFRNQKFMFIKYDDAIETITQKFMNNFGFVPDIAVSANSIETLFSFVLSDIGVAFVPEMFIKFANINYHPVYYPIDIPNNIVMLVTKKNRPLPECAKEYKKVLKHFSSL